MKTNKKVTKYYLEKGYPYAISILMCIILYMFRNTNYVLKLYNEIYDSTFLTAILSAVSIIFGFLLTTLTFLIQSSSPAINLIREHGRFKEFVGYNKTAVKNMFLSVVLTSIFLLTYKIEGLAYYDVFVAIWTYNIILGTLLSYRFLSLFYALI